MRRRIDNAEEVRRINPSRFLSKTHRRRINQWDLGSLPLTALAPAIVVMCVQVQPPPQNSLQLAFNNSRTADVPLTPTPKSTGDDAYNIRDLADWALQHYNSNHAGPEFQLPDRPTTGCVSFMYLEDLPTTDLKAACVGFREDLWYHINFSARQTDDNEHIFFAELRYGRCSKELSVETCIILALSPRRPAVRAPLQPCAAAEAPVSSRDYELLTNRVAAADASANGRDDELFTNRAAAADASANGRHDELFTNRAAATDASANGRDDELFTNRGAAAKAPVHGRGDKLYAV
ncbi:hypothetical protein D1007_15119 [Hordeum vulgare]|nr:hypothetical protein D1007_15119 [Hordeum vulgare]